MSESPPSDFRALGGDRYVLHSPHLDTSFEVDRLRRTKHQLVGELLVRCALPGATTVDGVLSVSELNLSSQRARATQAQYLARRARTNGGDVDWLALVEELSQRVLTAERRGSPSVDLADVPRSKSGEVFEVDGLQLPTRHPACLFGDGGSLKSLLILYFLGRLSLRGHRTLLVDWELDQEAHSERLELLFGKKPSVEYAHCDRPLTSEADRLRRIVRDKGIDYAAFDSVAPACMGRPEDAEVAAEYFRAVRAIGAGSVHVAHTTKGENGDQRPFGSTFWFNLSRSVWYVKLVEEQGNARSLGLYHRKNNLGPLLPAVGLEARFETDNVTFRPTDLASVPDLAAKLSIRQRMGIALQRGAMSPEALANEIDADTESVKRTARRYKRQFAVIDGGYLGLAHREAS